MIRAETPVADATMQRANEILDEFESSSILALLFAACSTPTARHRFVATSALLVACVRRPPAGSRVAVAGDLPSLVDSLRGYDEVVAAQDDFIPLDPSLVVTDVMDREGALFPVHPGVLEHPQHLASEILDYAYAVDRVATKIAGYGCADLLDVAGTLLRAQHAVLSPYWNPAPDLHISDPPSVSEGEVEAARTFLSQFDMEGFRAQGNNTKGQNRRRQLAVEAVTSDSDDIDVRHHRPATTLGPTLFIRGAGRCIPVPAALVMEGLAAATQRLLVGLSPNADAPHDRKATPSQWRACLRRSRTMGEVRFRDVVSAGVAHVIYPVRMYGRGRRDFALLITGHRHVVVVDLVVGLDPTELAADVPAARLALADIDGRVAIRIPPLADFTLRHRSDPISSDHGLTWIPGLRDAIPFTVPVEGGWVHLRDGTEVVGMVVVHGPWLEPVLRERSSPGASVVVCPLSALKEIVSEVSTDERDDLWAFIDEVASFGDDQARGTGVGAIHAFSVLDLWELWCEQDKLAPAWADPNTLIATKPVDTAKAWNAASRRSDLDWLLRAVGLPPVRSWPMISDRPLCAPSTSESVAGASASEQLRGWTEGSRETVTLSRMSPRVAVFASVLDRVVVTVDLEFEHQEFSREFAVRFADSLLAALQQLAAFQPEAWAVWTRANSDWPALVHVIPHALPEQAVRLLGCGAGEAVVVYDPVRVEAQTVTELHRELGEALRYAVEIWLDPPLENAAGGTPQKVDLRSEARSAEGRASGQVFLDGWCTLPPALDKQYFVDPFHKSTLAAPAQVSRGGLARAERDVMRALRGNLDEGIHSIPTIRTVVCPRALDVLRDAYGRFSAWALIDAAGAELERVLADRWKEKQRRLAALRDPWSSEHLESIREEDDGQATLTGRAAELLIESVLRHPPAGALIPDRRDVLSLLHLAAWPLDLAIRSAYASTGLAPSRLIVSPLGDLDIVPWEPAIFDPYGFKRAQWDAGLHAAHEEPEHDGSKAAVVALADAPVADLRSVLDEASEGSGPDAEAAASIGKVHGALLSSWGFGLDAIPLVLATLESWVVPDDPMPPMGLVRRNDLVADVAAWSGVPEAQVRAAVDRLTITSQLLRTDPFKYWQLEQRAVRLALRPLVCIDPDDGADDDGFLRVLPRRAEATAQVFLRYLRDGRLPWPPESQPRAVRTALAELRRVSELGLESEAEAIARTAGLFTRGRLTPRKARAVGLTLSGEIDVLAVDPGRRRVWVLECKHLYEPFSPPEIARRLTDIYGSAILRSPDEGVRPRQSIERSRSEIGRLAAKTEDVRRNVVSALKLVAEENGITDADLAEWQVMPAMVTGHVEAAAFAAEPAVCWVALRHLGALLQVPALPEPGWWEPWRH